MGNGMIEYNRRKPLIFIHLPKSGGVSVRKILESWYGNSLYLHYFDEKSGQLPHKHSLNKLNPFAAGAIVYGHFNRLRGFGVEDYYPGVDQFITILRDPLQLAISGYYFTRAIGARWMDKSGVPKEALTDYLSNCHLNMLNHFPCEVTIDNYREVIEKRFVAIGLTEHLDESMRRISRKLGQPYSSAMLEHLNAMPRDCEVPQDVVDSFIERHLLEYTVYNYVLEKFLAE